MSFNFGEDVKNRSGFFKRGLVFTPDAEQNKYPNGHEEKARQNNESEVQELIRVAEEILRSNSLPNEIQIILQRTIRNVNFEESDEKTKRVIKAIQQVIECYNYFESVRPHLVYPIENEKVINYSMLFNIFFGSEYELSTNEVRELKQLMVELYLKNNRSEVTEISINSNLPQQLLGFSLGNSTYSNSYEKKILSYFLPENIQENDVIMVMIDTIGSTDLAVEGRSWKVYLLASMIMADMVNIRIKTPNGTISPLIQFTGDGIVMCIPKDEDLLLKIKKHISAYISFASSMGVDMRGVACPLSTLFNLANTEQTTVPNLDIVVSDQGATFLGGEVLDMLDGLSRPNSPITNYNLSDKDGEFQFKPGKLVIPEITNVNMVRNKAQFEELLRLLTNQGLIENGESGRLSNELKRVSVLCIINYPLIHKDVVKEWLTFRKFEGRVTGLNQESIEITDDNFNQLVDGFYFKINESIQRLRITVLEIIKIYLTSKIETRRGVSDERNSILGYDSVKGNGNYILASGIASEKLLALISYQIEEFEKLYNITYPDLSNFHPLDHELIAALSDKSSLTIDSIVPYPLLNDKLTLLRGDDYTLTSTMPKIARFISEIKELMTSTYRDLYNLVQVIGREELIINNKLPNREELKSNIFLSEETQSKEGIGSYRYRNALRSLQRKTRLEEERLRLLIKKIVSLREKYGKLLFNHKTHPYLWSMDGSYISLFDRDDVNDTLFEELKSVEAKWANKIRSLAEKLNNNRIAVEVDSTLGKISQTYLSSIRKPS